METELERTLINSYKEGMIAYVQSHPEDVDQLIKLAIADKQPYSWRAAWLLWSCMEKDDLRVRDYVDAIIETLPTKKDGHQRELLKILSMMELDEDQEGYVFNICTNLWEKISKVPSVRHTAFRIIVEIAKKYPELSNEIGFLTQDQFLETLSPGVKKAVHKIIVTLQ